MRAIQRRKRVTVCVIIAAWNAERTIPRAIASALAQPEVSEVIVVDDASTDKTATIAQVADDGSGRLTVLRQQRNGGPSAARNRALDLSQADHVAVLDADDYFLPARFTALLAIPGWDAIADNIAFVPEANDDLAAPPPVDAGDYPARTLTLGGLLEGSISRRTARRGELGFLKPLVRRAFLDAHALRYDETLRLGEDFALYTRMLAAGAKFMTVARCGYVAVERRQSLSGSHATADLAVLLGSVDAWAAGAQLAPPDRALLKRYRAELSANFRHRRLLDDKREIGLLRALARLLDEPQTAPLVALRVLHDKRAAPTPPSSVPAVRYLLPR
jgi:succinoglycan biosynthesis protein ExoU